MRHIFIINPHAGKRRNQGGIRANIDAYFAKNGGAYSVIVTTSKEDTIAAAKDEAMKGGDVRLYAVGGDGTLSDVVNGVFGCNNAAVGVIPCGSGNDFVCGFGGQPAFLEIAGQVKGTAIPIDLIKSDLGLAVNQCSLGFDASVVLNQKKFKRLPFVGGSLSYTLAIFKSLASGIRHNVNISLEDGEPMRGDYLLCIAANGSFYGGGIKSAPSAVPGDGLLDFVLVDAVSRMTILKLLKKFRAGDHYTLPFVHPYQGEKINITSENPFPVNLDGEAFLSEEIRFEVVKKGIRFIVPSVCGDRIEEKAETGKGKMGVVPAYEIPVNNEQ